MMMIMMLMISVMMSITIIMMITMMMMITTATRSRKITMGMVIQRERESDR